MNRLLASLLTIFGTLPNEFTGKTKPRRVAINSRDAKRGRGVTHIIEVLAPKTTKKPVNQRGSFYAQYKPFKARWYRPLH